MQSLSFVLLAASALLAGAQDTLTYSVEDPDGFTGVASQSQNIVFDAREMVVNPGERVELTCGYLGQDMRNCVWNQEGGQTLQIQDVNDGLMPGYSRPADTENNQCGIVINAASIEHHGRWTCTVFIPLQTLSKSKDLVVTVKPTRPILEVESASMLEVVSGIESAVRCVVEAARPAVALRWFLGEEDITVQAATEETPTNDAGVYKSVSTLTRNFKPEDNGMMLICSATHKTLEVPETAEIKMNVVFAPVEKPVSTFYQIKPGQDYEIHLNFSANPEPTKKEWMYGDSFDSLAVTIPVPGADDRYTTNIESLGNGQYTAVLRISGFTETDANTRFVFATGNDHGETNYRVRLSMDEAPAETLSGGAVAGIVIVLLVIVAAVGAASYARYRQMFCFAPRAESKAHISDEEAANGTANDAIKASTDHVNGNANGNANGNGAVEHETPVAEESPLTEKKNTDV